MAVVTWDGSASTDFAADANWDTGSAPDGTSDVVIPDTSSINNPTLGADITINSLTVSANATIVGNASYTITCDGEADGTGATTSGYAVHMAGNGTIGTDLNITVTTAATTLVSLVPASGTVKNFTYNASGQECTGVGATTINGNLTITAGTFQMYNDVALTVTGDVSVTGTLTGNASAISMGSLTIAAAGTYSATSGTTTITSETGAGYAIFNTANGTFTHNSGTVHISMTSKNTLIFGMEGDDTSGTGANAFNNLTVTLSTDNRLELDPAAGNAHVIKGDVTIVEGHFKPDSTGHSLTIEGDVSIESGGTIGATNRTGDHTFGSLTIASGGTYIATSGTTTLNGGGANSDSNTSLYGEGTFTHNKGTLHFASGAAYRIALGGTFYNVTTDVQLYGYGGTLLPQPTMPDGTTAADFISIEGTFRINNASVYPYSWDGLYVHNLIIGDGTGSANSAKLSLAESDVFNGTVYVDNVTINSDGQFLFGDGDETSATAGSSALNIYGSFRNLGGNVTIE